jgi:hypothetical protein
MKKFFMLAADTVQGSNPSLADRLRKATPHWISTTRSVYLHADRGKWARQMRKVFPVEGGGASQR